VGEASLGRVGELNGPQREKPAPERRESRGSLRPRLLLKKEGGGRWREVSKNRPSLEEKHRRRAIEEFSQNEGVETLRASEKGGGISCSLTDEEQLRGNAKWGLGNLLESDSGIREGVSEEGASSSLHTGVEHSVIT